MAAIGIILVALLALAYTTTIGFANIALARQRQGANGLANQTMEQLRALPFATLLQGLDNADLASSTTVGSPSYDPRITTTGCGAAYCFAGEEIPRGDNSPVVPLVPHRQTVAVGPTTYQVFAYVTYYLNDRSSNTLRLTVFVTWANPARRGVSAQIQVQSIAFSPSGCTSSSTHPFSGPCQPFLYGTASVDPGHIDVSGFVDDLDQFDQVSLQLPFMASSMQIEQISAVQGLVQTSGVTLRRDDGSEQVGGQRKATSAADNDPAQPGQEWDRQTTGAQSSVTLTESQGRNSVSVTASSGDTGTTTSTVLATVSPLRPCPDLSGTNQNDAQPCGNTTGRQGGQMTATMELAAGSVDLGTTTLASVAAPPLASTVFSDRNVTPQGTRCVATATDGCVHVAATRSLGDVRLAGLPSGLGITPPLGWAGYTVAVTGFTDSLTAEVGRGTSAPTVTASGSVSVWNGAGYDTIPINPGASVPLPVQDVRVSGLVGGRVLEVHIRGSLATGGTSVTDPAGCIAPCNRTEAAAASNSPVTGSLFYTITYDGQVLANLEILVDLGTAHVEGTYKESPSA